MPLLRYTASADNTIVNAFQPNLRIRGTGSNAGAADVLEVFSIYGRQTTSSQELSRALLKFPVNEISADRTASRIPASGSVSFYLRVFNAPSSKTVPPDITIVVNPLKTAWQEGIGLDLEGYKDLTKGNIGSNWMSASSTSSWNSVSGGGDWLSSSADYRYEQRFASGLEDMEINITPLVERWIKGSGGGGIANYGMGIKLTSSQEASGSGKTVLASNAQSVQNNPRGATVSNYTKRFFARGSQYFFKRPTIEARWSDVREDDRGHFYFSSSRAPAADNLNTLYFYNLVRGRLTNLPSIGTGKLYVSLYSGSSPYNTGPSGSKLTLFNGTNVVTGGHVSTGIYSASVAIVSSNVEPLYDVWWSGSEQYFTGAIEPRLLSTGLTLEPPTYFINITNLKDSYYPRETARFNLFVRKKNWSPNIYTVAKNNPPITPIQSASYRVYRLLDAYEAVPYGTGSDFHTGLSYDVSGNYFDFNMKLLEPGYMYAFKFAFYDEYAKSWEEQDEVFRFKVEEY